MDVFQTLMDGRVEITEKLSEELSEARTNVILGSSLISYALFTCEIYFTSCDENPTACALVRGSGNYIFIDTTLWGSIKLKHRAGILYHETLHIFLEHGYRGRDNMYDPQKWNKATDYNINPTCKGLYKNDFGVVKDPRASKYFDMPEWVLYDVRYVGMSSDEIYELLDDDDDETEAFDVVDMEGDGFESDELIDAQVQKNRQTMMASIKMAEDMGGIGEHELGIVRQIHELTKPVVGFRDHLETFMRSSVPTRTTYRRISRKSSDVIFPSLEGNHMNLLIGIDTSGSTRDSDIVECMSEVVGLAEDLDSWTIHVVSCDSKPYYVAELSSDTFETGEIKDLKLRGGGGTILGPMLNSVEGVEYESIDAAIIMTDGHLNDDDVESCYDGSFPVIVMVTENGNEDLVMKNNEIRVIKVDKSERK